ncbi:UNVERIFIED_CONTAM: hypothetical protein K2H54_002354 [Gekko kuhli]
MATGKHENRSIMTKQYLLPERETGKGPCTSLDFCKGHWGDWDLLEWGLRVVCRMAHLLTGWASRNIFFNCLCHPRPIKRGIDSGQSSMITLVSQEWNIMSHL